MSAYAQTNVQLYNQLGAAGYSAADVERIHHAYGLAMELFTGSFRGSGRPFLNHLVGTASVLATCRVPIAVVAAGLLHSAYSHGEFGNYWRGMSATKRARVRARAGADVEALVAAYTRLPWTEASIRALPAALDGLDEHARQVLLVRLANEVDDHEDLGLLYSPKAGGRRAFIRSALVHCVALAERLGQPALGRELARVFEATLAGEVAPAVRGPEDGSFLLAPASHTWRPAVRARWMKARLLGRQV